jgi:peptidoglycan hydrolase CwlO-like protein
MSTLVRIVITVILSIFLNTSVLSKKKETNINKNDEKLTQVAKSNNHNCNIK